MNEFEAAMGICNLRNIKSYIEARKKVVQFYKQRLYGVDGIVFWEEQDNTEHNYSYLPILFNKFKYSRDEVQNMLLENGIFARKYFYPLTCEFSSLRKYNKNNTPNAKRISDNILVLPLYPELTEDEVNDICNIILK